MSEPGRRRAEGWGRRAEDICALALRMKGYRILARRFRCPARSSPALAVEALTARQRARLERAALAFLATGAAGIAPQSHFSLRFDVMAVSPWRWPRHLPDAWRPEVSGAGLGVL